MAGLSSPAPLRSHPCNQLSKPPEQPGRSWPLARRSGPGCLPELPASPAASLLCGLGTQVAVEPDSSL